MISLRNLTCHLRSWDHTPNELIDLAEYQQAIAILSRVLTLL